MAQGRYFPLFFIGLWLLISTVLAVLSRWFSLMTRYPNRPETPLLKLGRQSGSMGMRVGLNGILTLSACHPASESEYGGYSGFSAATSSCRGRRFPLPGRNHGSWGRK
jgi:hypothetical protein